ncbi:Mobile element protein [Candidatus Enterovibrio escicola]|uniref:Mobile element protein n=1 Tax=Candidatus Enterovibrio escicola TaxID=1927127 RepID=A0A2A5T636_9GAMM|nr:Mobile element protein [Candidatus Enterovibrio escacola]
MCRYEQLFAPELTLRNCHAQVSKALVNMKGMNKVIRLSIPVR